MFSTIVVSGDLVNLTLLGEYTLYYTCTDSCDESITIQRNVTIVCGGDYINGDANIDGLINSVDITLMIDHIIDAYYMNDEQICKSNIITDDHINVADVVSIIEIILNF